MLPTFKYLSREITDQQHRLKELEQLATTSTVRITGMPKVRALSDKIGDYVAEIAYLRSLLDLNSKNAFMS